ncbi:hypothetical protein PISMIDRAFT_687212, partial [Pisolithus microcarpus 441]
MRAPIGEMLVGHDLGVCCITPPPPISPGWCTRRQACRRSGGMRAGCVLSVYAALILWAG